MMERMNESVASSRGSLTEPITQATNLPSCPLGQADSVKLK